MPTFDVEIQEVAHKGTAVARDAAGRTLATCTAIWFALPRVRMEQVA